MARASNYIHRDNGEYLSPSTIDNEPREPKMDENEQLEMFTEESIEKLQEAPHERKIAVNLTLKVTPAGDKTITIPVLCGEYPSSRIAEMLSLSLTGRRFARILEAALDNPTMDA